MNNRLLSAVCTLIMLGSCVVTAGFTQQPEPLDDPDVTGSQRVSSLLARTALLDLGLQESPGIDDYSCVQALMSIASQLDETNADLARMLAEACWSSGDQGALLDATRTIVRNDPKDTVALLRLIGANINKGQTVEDRLKSYEKYLGPAAAAIDASVRSRLALDAALLERETGDADGFSRHLMMAQRLDPSNKDAAVLAAQILGEANANPVDRFRLEIKVLMADPLDPHIHTTMAIGLATEGAIVQAKRFMDNAANLYNIGGQAPPKRLREQRMALAWQIHGPELIVKQLNGNLHDMRAQASAMIESRELANEPTDGLNRPEDIRLDVEVEQIRMLAALVTDDMDTVRASLGDLTYTTTQIQLEAIDAMNNFTSDRNALFNKYVISLLTLEAMRTVVGLEAEQMREDVDRLVNANKMLADVFQRIEPWILYTEGKYQEAIDGINPETKSSNSIIVLALANEKLGDTDAAARWYSRLSREFPLTGFGSFARSQLVVLGHKDDIISRDGHRMSVVANTLPAWLDKIILNPSSYQSLAVDSIIERVGPLQEPVVQITLQNLSPIPLGIGASRPIDSRILLVSGSQPDAKRHGGATRPKVVELNRRLRLKPQESLVVRVNPDGPYTDWVLQSNPFRTLTGRWRALQGFTPAPYGGLINSPFGLVSESRITHRLPLSEVEMTDQELVQALESEDINKRRRAVRAINAVLLSADEKYKRTRGEAESLVDALMVLYTKAESYERAEMLMTLPISARLAAMEPLDELAREQIVVDGLVDKTPADASLMCAVLMTRVDDPLNPVFEAAQAHPDERVQLVGLLMSQRLSEGAMTLATTADLIGVMESRDSKARLRP